MSCVCKYLRWTSDLTSQYSVNFFKYFDIILHSRNVNQLYIYLDFFSGSHYFFLMFQPYREIVIITLQFVYRNMFIRLFISTDDQINLQWHFDRIFSQTVYVMKEPKLSISICIYVLNRIYL